MALHRQSVTQGVRFSRGDANALAHGWRDLTPAKRVAGFTELRTDEQHRLFTNLPTHDQAEFLVALTPPQRRIWFGSLAPDDAADVLQEIGAEERTAWLALLDGAMQAEVCALMAYAEDDAGGLMNPRFARVRDDMTVEQAVRYLQRQARDRLETIYYAYIVDCEQRLRGVLSFRELFTASPGTQVRDVMHADPVRVGEDVDQEEVAHRMRERGLLALPVVDGDDRIRGIVTIDDIVDVFEEEATEDAQKYGGMEALDAPYMKTGFWAMIRKRAGWLAVLFLGEMLTASAMGHFEEEIARAVVLALFVPLIISSGGNSGSQASTLIVRAMALGEVRLRDWWRIIRRELAAGVTLGVLLATIGVVRIFVWQSAFGSYGEHVGQVALTVGLSLIGVVCWGTVSGSMLPFILRKVGFDPASASAPFVATLVDVSGLIIYFEVAKWVFAGTLL